MAAAQTKGHEEDEHTGIAGEKDKKKKKKRKTKSRKQGTKASKQENRTQGVFIATDLPVSATKPRRGPCHTICHLLLLSTTNVSSVITAAFEPRPPRTKINENQTKLPGLGDCSTSGCTY